MNCNRVTPPNYIRHIYDVILKNRNWQMAENHLIASLKQAMLFGECDVAQIVANCVDDKTLIPSVTDNRRESPRSKPSENRTLRIPKRNEILEMDHDYYCYECHLPNNVEFCSQCPRSFHRDCYRVDPKIPNYVVPSTKVQKNPLPDFNAEANNAPENSEDNAPQISSSAQQVDENATDTSNNAESEILELLSDVKDQFNLNIDNKSKMDVLCIGMVRPPNRTRRSNAISSPKSEIIAPEEDDSDMLCTRCRLCKFAALSTPPNLESDELCHLLNYTYIRNISWLSTETIIYLHDILSERLENKMLKAVLLKIPIGPKDIFSKIENNIYKYLMEFLSDILDLQHNLGVIFGDSVEMESTKWLIRDISHDLSEIQRCPDCFRYSNDKKSPGWFCKPCVQRHELVYAKVPGFPFWPAKVVRVLPNNKHDVRFFGADHSRALVDVKNIRPIDTSRSQLKLPRDRPLQKALEELRHHQLLLHYSPREFSFRADKNVVRALLERTLLEINPRKRRCSAPNINSPIEIENRYQSMEISQSSSRKRRRINTPRNQTNLNTSSSSPSQSDQTVEHLKGELGKAEDVIKQHENTVVELLKEIENLQTTISRMERKIETVKKKQWCFHCGLEAVLICCFKASYCTKKCQKADWNKGHRRVCRNIK